MPNRNTLYAHILVDELARAGLRHVCLAPGSRNTPLVLAFAQHPAIKAYSHLDERSAAFFALGLALATDAPAAVVCTSGSAAANFLPAIVEAHQSQVPLLILTADRPHELRYSGANQTMDQVKMFGGFTLWSVDMPLPEANPPALATRNLRTLAGRAYARANGLRKGVVHLNLPLRPPLEPTEVASDSIMPPPDAVARAADTPYTQISPVTAPAISQSDLDALVELIHQHERGLLICGPRCPGDETGALIARLAQQIGYPALVDGTSGMRFGQTGLIGGYDTFLRGSAFPAPEVVLRFGAVPTSKWLNQYLDNNAPPQVIHFSPSGEWADDSHRLSQVIQADPAAAIPAMLARLTQRITPWMQMFQAAETLTRQIIADAVAREPYFDGAVVYDMIDLLPDGACLFTGNSLPVRHLDQLGLPTVKQIAAFANRGVSGIDGNVSTALGIGAARPDAPLAVVVGDITFYHDMNGLLAIGRCGVPATIVVLNNNGGGIFRRLPISQFEPEFTHYFVTPHNLDFAHAARLYGLDYARVSERTDFRQIFSQSMTRRAATLIEVCTDAQVDLARQQEIVARVQVEMANQRHFTIG